MPVTSSALNSSFVRFDIVYNAIIKHNKNVIIYKINNLAAPYKCKHMAMHRIHGQSIISYEYVTILL